MLEDCSLTIAGLATSEEDVWSLVHHEGIFLSEWETSQGVWSCRADMSRLKEQLQLTNGCCVFLVKSTVKMYIVQVLPACTEELDAVSHGELMRISH